MKIVIIFFLLTISTLIYSNGNRILFDSQSTNTNSNLLLSLSYQNIFNNGLGWQFKLRYNLQKPITKGFIGIQNGHINKTYSLMGGIIKNFQLKLVGILLSLNCGLGKGKLLANYSSFENKHIRNYLSLEGSWDISFYFIPYKNIIVYIVIDFGIRVFLDEENTNFYLDNKEELDHLYHTKTEYQNNMGWTQFGLGIGYIF